MNRASDGPDTPQRNRNNVPDLIEANLLAFNVRRWQPTVSMSTHGTFLFEKLIPHASYD